MSRRVVLLLTAGLIAIGTIVAAHALMGPTETKAPTPVETTQVLAAARDLPTGSILKEMDMKWIPWAETAENSKFYVKGKADMGSLVGAVLRDGLHADEPFLMGRVVQPHEQGFLAAVLTPGMRAVSVTLTPGGEVAGFIFPGDRVDVILTHDFSRKDVSSLSERHVTETVLTNVRVLALDQKSDNQSTDPKVAQLATLEVSPKQAEKLALASEMVGNQSGGGKGSILLALRSLASDDASVPSATGSPLNDMGAGATPGPTWDSEVSPDYPSIDGKDRLTQSVQVMRGKDVSQTTFERH